MVDIFYTQFSVPFSPGKWQSYLNGLPANLQKKVLRFRRWQDQHAALLSNLLLQQALGTVGYSPNCLSQLQYTEYQRPFIDSQHDFNISHSGEFVVCALAQQGRLGIDIEQVKPIALADFKNYMTLQQWGDIMAWQPPHERFYDYWTIKESVMKADGRGLNIPLQDIHTENSGQAKLYDTSWFLHRIRLDSHYACHLATCQQEVTIQLHLISF
jgi:4'-phosphopantetheinyl transferase